MIRSNVGTLQRAVWESLIIAVGVLVALAANNWNEARQERPDLVARLEDMICVQNRMMTRYTWVVSRSQKLLDDIGEMR